MRQTRLPIDWIVGAEQTSSESSSEEEEVKRGRPAQPLQWTRVKSLALMRNQRIMVYDGSQDLRWDKTTKAQRVETQHGGGDFVFDPQSFAQEAARFSTATHRVPEAELERYAKLATELRNKFSQKADALLRNLNGNEPAEPDLSAFEMPRLSRGCKKADAERTAEDLHLGFESHYVRLGGRKRRRASLSTTELKALAQMVIKDGVTARDAALVFNVKPTMVWKLVRDVRRAERSYDSIRSK